MTVRETARLLRVSPVTVRRYIKAGRLQAVRIGRNVRIEREAVEKLPTVRDERDSDVDFLVEDNPIWKLVGVVADDDSPADLSANKQKYLAEAYGDLQHEQPTSQSSLGRDSIDAAAGRLLTMRHPIWEHIGMSRGENESEDVSEHKGKYVAEAHLAKDE